MAEDGDEVHSRGRAIRSGTWATAQQFVTLASTALTAVLLARSLDVAQFGLFSYATTLASLGSIVLAAGMSALAIRDLVAKPAEQSRTMTALVVIRETVAVVAYIVLLGASFLTNSNGAVAATAIALLVLFARAWDATEIWFQSRAESGRTAPIRITVVLLMLGIRLLLALLGAPLEVFLWLYVAESFLISSLFVVRYLRAPRSPGFAKPELQTPKSLFRQSWMLALASLAEQVNSRGDIVVIQALLGSASVGIYASAARLSEMLYFLPVVFMTATFPRLLQIRKRHGAASSEYNSELQAGYDRAFWAGGAATVGLILVGPWLLVALFGEEYAQAGLILQVHALALPFVFMAAVLSKWLVAEGLLWFALVRFGLAAIINISLNFVLINAMGVVGSAWATVASYIFASFLVIFVSRRTRPAAYQMLLAVAAPVRLLRRRRNG